MTPKKKAFLILGSICLLAILAVLGTGFYLYYNPRQIKPFLERSLSAYADSTCTIAHLSYSLRPTRIEARDISFTPRKPQKKASLTIRLVKADIGFKGLFGRRSLILKNFQISGINVDLSSGLSELSALFSPKKRKPSFLSNLTQRLVGVFLFKSVQFESGEIINGRFSAIMGGRSIMAENIRAKAAVGKPLLLSFGLKAADPLSKVALNAPAVTIRTDTAFDLIKRNLNGTIDSGRMTFQSPEMGIGQMDGSARFQYDHGGGKLSLEKLDISALDITTPISQTDLLPFRVAGAKKLTVEAGPTTYEMDKGQIASALLNIRIADLKLKAQTGQTSLYDLEFKSKAAVNLNARQIELTRFQLMFADIMNLKGDFWATSGPKSAIRLAVSQATLSSEKSLYFLPANVRQSLAAIEFAGPVTLSGDIAAKTENRQMLWQCNLASNFKQIPFAFGRDGMRLKGLATADLNIKGQFPAVVISAKIKAEKTKFSTPTLVSDPSGVDFSLSMRYPRIDIQNATALIPQATYDPTSRNIRVKKIRLHIPSAQVDIEKKSVSMAPSHLDSVDLKNLTIGGGIQNKRIHLSVAGRETGFFQFAAKNRLLPAVWDFKGREAFDIKAAQTKDGLWKVQSALSFENFAFQNKSGSHMGENISLNIDADGIYNLKKAGLTFTTSLKVPRGEALFDRFYLDLAKNPITASGRGTYQIQPKILDVASLRFEMKNILPLEIEGRIHSNANQNDITVRIPPVSLKPIFQNLLKDPFKSEKPILDAIETEGTISAKLRLKKMPGSWQATGRLNWQDGKLSMQKKGVDLKGIQLDFPIWYQTGLKKTPHRQGRLEIDTLAVPLLPQQSLKIGLDIGPNQLLVKTPTNIQTPGGVLRLGPVRVEDIFSSDPEIRTSLSFDGIKLKPFLSGLWPQLSAGSLSGRLNPVRYKGHLITSKGKVTAKVFGGRVAFSDFSASGIFTSVPVFKLNIEGQDLLLADMTTGTSFGKIEGVLSGYIRNFEIADRQPQKFKLLLETHPKKGIPQKISVKAVDNIAQIGGGQSPFIGLAGVMASFFKTFPYRKIGIRADLENDLFTINGTIKEGDIEYLVKRGRFSGVNVVNQNPNNRASFKDMVKRIKRVSQKGGPIVK